MTRVILLIYYLKAQSSLCHCLLKKFLTELDAQYNDLQSHDNVSLLSKGKALKRPWDVKDEIGYFLISISSVAADNHLKDIASIAFMTKAAFLTDLFGHINELNSSLLCEKLSSVCETRSSAPSLKLKLFAHDINNDMLHFSTLKGYVTSKAVPVEFPEFVDRIYKEFDARFKQFEKISDILNLVKDPKQTLLTSPDWIHHISVAALQLELCDIQATLPAQELELPLEFWTSPTTTESYPSLAKLAITVLTIFG